MGLFGSKPAPGEYDVIVHLDKLKTTAGWPIFLSQRLQDELFPTITEDDLPNYSIDPLKRLLSDSKREVAIPVIAFCGAFNRGKTFCMNKIADLDLPSGHTVHTSGLSMMIPKSTEQLKNRVLLDMAGSNNPVVPGKESVDSALVEGMNTDDFLWELAFVLSDAFVVVVNEMTAQDQKFLAALRMRIAESEKDNKELFVIHNYKSATSEDEVFRLFQKHCLSCFRNGILHDESNAHFLITSDRLRTPLKDNPVLVKTKHVPVGKSDPDQAHVSKDFRDFNANQFRYVRDRCIPILGGDKKAERDDLISKIEDAASAVMEEMVTFDDAAAGASRKLRVSWSEAYKKQAVDCSALVGHHFQTHMPEYEMEVQKKWTFVRADFDEGLIKHQEKYRSLAPLQLTFTEAPEDGKLYLNRSSLLYEGLQLRCAESPMVFKPSYDLFENPASKSLEVVIDLPGLNLTNIRKPDKDCPDPEIAIKINPDRKGVTVWGCLGGPVEGGYDKFYVPFGSDKAVTYKTGIEFKVAAASQRKLYSKQPRPKGKYSILIPIDISKYIIPSKPQEINRKFGLPGTLQLSFESVEGVGENVGMPV